MRNFKRHRTSIGPVYQLPYPGPAGSLMSSGNQLPSNWGPGYLNRGQFATGFSPSGCLTWKGRIQVGGDNTTATATFSANAVGSNDGDPGSSYVFTETRSGPDGNRSYVVIQNMIIKGRVTAAGGGGARSTWPGLEMRNCRLMPENAPAPGATSMTNPAFDSSWTGYAGLRGFDTTLQQNVSSGATTVKVIDTFTNELTLAAAYGGQSFLLGPIGSVPSTVTYSTITQISTTLSAAIDSSQTNIPVTDGSQIVNGDLVKIDSEVLLVTAGGGTNTLTATRGYQTSSPASHSNGAAVTAGWTLGGCSGVTSSYLAGEECRFGIERTDGRVDVTNVILGSWADLHFWFGGDIYGDTGCCNFSQCEPEVTGAVPLQRIFLQYVTTDGMHFDGSGGSPCKNMRVAHGSGCMHPAAFNIVPTVHGDQIRIKGCDSTALNAVNSPAIEWWYFASNRGNSGTWIHTVGSSVFNIGVKHCLFSIKNKAVDWGVDATGGSLRYSWIDKTTGNSDTLQLDEPNVDFVEVRRDDDQTLAVGQGGSPTALAGAADG